MSISKRQAQWWIAGVWLCGFCILAAVLLFQVSMTSMFEGKSKRLWDWFLPATVPTVGLIIGTLVGSPQEGRESRVEKGVFYLAVALSASYLLLLAVLVATVSLRYSWTPIEDTAPLLAAIQGLVTLAVGAFFVRGKSADPK